MAGDAGSGPRWGEGLSLAQMFPLPLMQPVRMAALLSILERSVAGCLANSHITSPCMPVLKRTIWVCYSAWNQNALKLYPFSSWQAAASNWAMPLQTNVCKISVILLIQVILPNEERHPGSCFSGVCTSTCAAITEIAGWNLSSF